MWESDTCPVGNGRARKIGRQFVLFWLDKFATLVAIMLKWKNVVLYLVRVAAVPAALLLLVGPRRELIGITVGIGLLALPVARGRVMAIVLPVGAAIAAVAAGFRIQFITNPTGGYVYFTHTAFVITFLWIAAMLGVRTELERRLPHHSLQVMIDAVVVLNAVFLVAISPQARANHLAVALAIAGVIVLITYKFLPHRAGYAPEHAVIAFIFAAFGISGAVKGAVSISLLGPLAVLGVPFLITAQAHFSPAAAVLLPRWFRENRYSQDEFVGAVFIVTTALVSAAIIAAHYPIGYAFIPAVVIPAVYGWDRLRRRVARFVDTDAKPGGLFGIEFAPVTLEQAVARAQSLVGIPGPARIVVTPNPSAVLISMRDPALRAAYTHADLVLADGIGIVWALRTLGRPVPARVTGVDLTLRLMRWAGTRSTRVFLLGGRPGVAQRAAQRLRTQFPGINIVGTHHGYFATDADVIAQIAAARPDIVLVGMGVPRQERFMLTARAALSDAVLIGVGGTLDLLAGLIKRAPQAWQRWGLEWVYRTVHEPHRITRVWDIPRFIVLVWTLRAVSTLAAVPIRPPDRPLPLAPFPANHQIRDER